MTAADRITVRLALLGIVVLAGLVVLLRSLTRPGDAAPPTWGDIAPPLTVPLHGWRWIVLHHSATQRGDAASIDRSHRQERGWDGIGYHFVVGNGLDTRLGEVQPTFRWQEQRSGAHAGAGPNQAPYNSDGVGICAIGDFTATLPQALQEQRLAELCALLIHHIPSLSLERIISHGQVPDKVTACPGRLDPGRIRFLARQVMTVNGWTVR